MSARIGRSTPRSPIAAGPLVAAIYARKSTEQAGVTDEQRSVTRQIEHARLDAVRIAAAITGLGFTVAWDKKGGFIGKKPLARQRGRQTYVRGHAVNCAGFRCSVSWQIEGSRLRAWAAD